MLFGNIPIRVNGERPSRDWFNAIRLAGMFLQNMIGPGAAFGSAALLNNQASAQLIPLLVFSSDSVRAAYIDFSLRVKTDSVDLVEVGSMLAWFDPASSSWMLQLGQIGGADSGIDFEINSATGQISYTSANQSGAYDSALSKITFTSRTVGV